MKKALVPLAIALALCQTTYTKGSKDLIPSIKYNTDFSTNYYNQYSLITTNISLSNSSTEHLLMLFQLFNANAVFNFKQINSHLYKFI